MNWIDFKKDDKGTWPMSHEKVFVVFRLLPDKFLVGRANIDIRWDEFKSFSWTYLMPYEMKDTNIDDFLSKVEMMKHALTFEQVRYEQPFYLGLLEYIYLLCRLHVYESSEILIGENLNSHFIHDIDMETHFIIHHKNIHYLVSTKGYSYCKEIVRMEIDSYE